MKFNAKMSRSMVLKKLGVTDRIRFKFEGEVIPTVTEAPIKCLGKAFDDTLKDRNKVKATSDQLENWLRRIDKKDLPGKYKVWCVQHGVLMRILWQLQIYEIPMTTMEKMERCRSRRLRRWFRLQLSFTNFGLYGKETKLQLPFTTLSKEFKASK